MDVNDPIYQFELFLSNTFGLPLKWFEFPSVILYVFIPAAALALAWYILLYKRIHIFKSATASGGIAITLSLLSTPVIAVFGPGFTTAIAIGASVLVMGHLDFFRVVASILVGIAIGIAYPILLELISKMFII